MQLQLLLPHAQQPPVLALAPCPAAAWFCGSGWSEHFGLLLMANGAEIICTHQGLLVSLFTA